jgi:hypothetical protein
LVEEVHRQEEILQVEAPQLVEVLLLVGVLQLVVEAHPLVLEALPLVVEALLLVVEALPLADLPLEEVDLLVEEADLLVEEADLPVEEHLSEVQAGQFVAEAEEQELEQLKDLVLKNSQLLNHLR